MNYPEAKEFAMALAIIAAAMFAWFVLIVSAASLLGYVNN
jgi:hypothetical protein